MAARCVWCASCDSVNWWWEVLVERLASRWSKSVSLWKCQRHYCMWIWYWENVHLLWFWFYWVSQALTGLFVFEKNFCKYVNNNQWIKQLTVWNRTLRLALLITTILSQFYLLPVLLDCFPMNSLKVILPAHSQYSKWLFSRKFLYKNCTCISLVVFSMMLARFYTPVEW